MNLTICKVSFSAAAPWDSCGSGSTGIPWILGILRLMTLNPLNKVGSHLHVIYSYLSVYFKLFLSSFNS